MAMSDPLSSAAKDLAQAQAELKAAQEKFEAACAKLADEERNAASANGGSRPHSSSVPPSAQSQPYYAHQFYSRQIPPFGQQVPPFGQQVPPFGRQVPPFGQQADAQAVIATKDHVGAGLLALLLGSLGVHKFYLGYNTSGFIMLGVSILGGILTLSLASLVVWLIAIIEGVIYLTRTQSEFEQLYVFNKREWF